MKKEQKNGIIIILILILLIIVIVALFFIFNKKSDEDMGYQVPNPSTIFCKESGFKSEVRINELGEQDFCIFPDGSECNTWSYFCGCTNDKRYCSKKYPSCPYKCK